jgi:hypothetical protein
MSDQGTRPEGAAVRTTPDTFFGGFTLMVSGAAHVIAAVSILQRGSYLPVPSVSVAGRPGDAWAWVLVALAVVAAPVGFLVVRGQRWACVAGVTIAMTSAVVNLALLQAFPLWALILIGFDVLVVYGLVVHRHWTS